MCCVSFSRAENRYGVSRSLPLPRGRREAFTPYWLGSSDTGGLSRTGPMTTPEAPAGAYTNSHPEGQVEWLRYCRRQPQALLGSPIRSTDWRPHEHYEPSSEMGRSSGSQGISREVPRGMDVGRPIGVRTGSGSCVSSLRHRFVWRFFQADLHIPSNDGTTDD